MADYYNIRAPQWIDFTQNCSPIQVQDFFDKEHTIHERIEEPYNPTAENMENTQSVGQDILCDNPQAQADLDIIKSTPVKVISPKYRNKETVVAEGTYDQVFNDAMRKLELCKNVSKPRDVLNKSTQEPKIFKTPNMPKITKISRSVGCVLNKNNQFNQNSTKVNKTSNNYMKKLSIKQSLFEQDKNSAESNTVKKSNNPDDTENNENKQYNKEDNEECKEEISKECKEKDNECNKESNDKNRNEEDNNEKHNEEDKKLQDEQIESTNDSKNNEKAENCQDDIDAKNNRTQPIKQVVVLTWHNHRRKIYNNNIHKRRTSGNKYIGLAEAVSRFQTETPKRFRTKSNKTISPSFYASKLLQNRLKPTIPISPALISKTRTRPVTVLSQEEREMLEIEEMKKHRIKANPIPSNVLRGPRATTKVNNFTRKSLVTTNTSSAIQSNEKTKSSSQFKSPHRDKASGLKNTIPNIIVTDSEGIIVKHEKTAFFGVPKNTTKNATCVIPFSFEARNKEMQMKKQQRLKNLQEASNAKVEFHARPAPNFSKPSTASSTKPPTPSVKQQQNTKRLIEPCPFSFEERNRKLLEKKEQLVKQVLEEKKRLRVFRASPAPVFKPVMVRGRSKELLSVKNKNIKTESERKADNEEYKCEDQENKEPNEIDSCKTESENMQRATKSAACNDDKLPLKPLPLELNTDKRAIKRREFDEKLKQKEMEEEMKRQEQEKKQLEHEKQLKMELRKLAEVKARPIPKYKPLIPVKSTKQLTNPQSPAFASKLRSKQV